MCQSDVNDEEHLCEKSTEWKVWVEQRTDEDPLWHRPFYRIWQRIKLRFKFEECRGLNYWGNLLRISVENRKFLAFINRIYWQTVLGFDQLQPNATDRLPVRTKFFSETSKAWRISICQTRTARTTEVWRIANVLDFFPHLPIALCMIHCTVTSDIRKHGLKIFVPSAKT